MRLMPWIVGGGVGLLLLALNSKTALAAVTQALPKDERTKKILEVAAQRGIPAAVALAVFDIESSGKGFASDGKMIIRYEPHIFKKYTSVDVPAQRAGQAAEWANFAKASAVNQEAAIKSISMGIAQIMGFNYKWCGFDSPQAMFNAMSSSEAAQIVAFFDFIKSASLETAARTGQWTTFANHYNGPAQKGYDTKLANRYKYYVDRGYQGIA